MNNQSNPVQDNCKISLVRNGLLVEFQLLGTNETIIDTLSEVLSKHPDFRKMIQIAMLQSLFNRY